MLARLRRDQFGGDADLVAGAAHRSLDQIGGIDLARDQPGADALILEREGRVPLQHPIERLQRQRADQILGQAVGKIFVGAVAEIGERQYADDRGPVLRRLVGLLPQAAAAGAGRLPGPDLDRLVDVLEAVRSRRRPGWR